MDPPSSWKVSPIKEWKASLAAAVEIYQIGLVTYFIVKGIFGWRLWPVNLVGEIIQWLLIPAFPSAILSVCFRRWRAAALSTVNIIAWLLLFGGLFTPHLKPTPVCSAYQTCFDLTVVSYNVAAGLPDDTELIELLRTSESDVIGLQELSAGQAYLINNSLADLYPYRVLQPPIPSEGIVTGLGVLSRYPIVNASYHQTTFQSDYLMTPIRMSDDRTLTILVARLPSPRLQLVGPSSSESIDSRSGKVSLALANIFTEYSPFILLADMNATSQSIQYATFTQGGLIDAYKVGGYGLGLTFPSGASSWRHVPPIPLVRIDMIWLQGYFEVVDSWVIREAVSDHRPVAARILWYPQRPRTLTGQDTATARVVERNGRLLCLPANIR